MTAVPNTEIAFLDERRTYLGGSDIACLLGIAPATWERNTPLQLYLSKTEPVKERAEKAVLRRGKRWEAVVAEMLIERLESRGHTVEVVNCNVRYHDPEHPFFRAEIDWEIRLGGEEEITNVELKTVHPFRLKEWGDEDTDDLPVHYTAQAMWGLGVTQRSHCIVAALFGADELKVYSLEADLDLIAGMRERALTFWTQHVVPRIPPPPVNLLDLSALFPTDSGREVEFKDNQRALDALADLRTLKGEEKELKTRLDAAEKIVKEEMQDATVAKVGGNPACTWKHQKQSRVDVTALREKHPQVAKSVSKDVEFRKFELSRAKGARS